jgi:hypothetical protein
MKIYFNNEDIKDDKIQNILNTDINIFNLTEHIRQKYSVSLEDIYISIRNKNNFNVMLETYLVYNKKEYSVSNEFLDFKKLLTLKETKSSQYNDYIKINEKDDDKQNEEDQDQNQDQDQTNKEESDDEQETDKDDDSNAPSVQSSEEEVIINEDDDSNAHSVHNEEESDDEVIMDEDDGSQAPSYASSVHSKKKSDDEQEIDEDEDEDRDEDISEPYKIHEKSVIEDGDEDIPLYIICKDIKGKNCIVPFNSKLSIKYIFNHTTKDNVNIDENTIVYIFSRQYVLENYQIYHRLYFPLEKVYKIYNRTDEKTYIFMGFGLKITLNLQYNEDLVFVSNYIYDTDNIYTIINKLTYYINTHKDEDAPEIKNEDVYLFDENSCLTHKWMKIDKSKLKPESTNTASNSGDETGTTTSGSENTETTTGTGTTKVVKKRTKIMKLIDDYPFNHDPDHLLDEYNNGIMNDDNEPVHFNEIFPHFNENNSDSVHLTKYYMTYMYHNIKSLLDKDSNNTFLMVTSIGKDGKKLYEGIENIIFPEKAKAIFDDYNSKTNFVTNTFNNNYNNVLSIESEIKQISLIQISKDLYNYYKSYNLDYKSITINKEIKLSSMVNQINFNTGYTEEHEFIDLNKIFDQFKLTQNIPFLKLRRGKNTEAYYKIYKDLLNDVSETTLKEWISKSSKNSNNLIGGRGLTFKIYFYDTSKEVDIDRKKYITVNLFKNGRLEIKSQWFEEDMSDYKVLSEIIRQKVYNLIVDINKIEYQVQGKRDIKISTGDVEKDLFQTSNYSMNIYSRFFINDDKKINTLQKHLLYYNSYLSVINTNKNRIVEKNGTINESAEEYISHVDVRYKRIDNFFPDSTIMSFIKEYFDTNGDGNDNDLKAKLIEQFKISDSIILAHLNTYKNKTLIYNDLTENKGFNSYKQGIFIRLFKDIGKKEGTISIMGIRSIEQYNEIINMFNIFFISYINYETENGNIFEQFNDIKVTEDDELQNLIDNDSTSNSGTNTNTDKYNSDISNNKEVERSGQRIKDLKKVFNLDVKLNYPRACGKERQPWIISKDTYKTKMSELSAEETEINALLLEDPDNEELNDRLKSVQEKLTIFNNGKEFKKNAFLFCPNYYNPTSKNIISSIEYNKLKATGMKLHHIEESMQNNNFLGISNSAMLAGKCLPCCFAKLNNTEKEKLNKCVDGIEDTSDDIHGDVEYILDSNKRLPKNRYGLLSNTLNKLFNNDKQLINQMKSGFHGYLRFCAENNFLKTILKVMNVNLNTFIQNIKDNLDEITLKSYKNGIIYNIFKKRDSDFNDVKKNFIDYIEKNKYLSEELLWEFCNKQLNCNIVIFEKNNDGIDILKCPIGHNMNNFVNYESNGTIILYKFSDKSDKKLSNFDVISYVEYNSTIKSVMLHENKNEFIINLLEQMTTYCNEIIDENIYTERSNLLNENPTLEYMNIENNPIDYYEYMSSLEGINDNSLTPINQIIDNYNKTNYLILNNKLMIPIKPTSLITSIPIIEYSDDLLLDIYETKEKLQEVQKHVVGYTLKMLIVYENEGESYVVGLLLNNGLTLPIIKIKLNKDSNSSLDPNEYYILEKDEKIYVRPYDSDINVDKAINSYDETDEIKLSVNKRKFEDETFQRLRYEFSKFIKDNIEFTNQIVNIKNDKVKMNNEKRKELRVLVKEIVNEISHVVNEITDEELINYNIPNFRISCLNNEKAKNDPHCVKINSKSQSQSGTDDVYRVKIVKRNLIDGSVNRLKYTSLIVEELIKNKWNELLVDNVDNVNNYNYLDKHDDEHLIVNNNFSKTKEEISKFYHPKDENEIMSEQHYDVLNTYDDDNININSYVKTDLSPFWLSLLGKHYKVLEFKENYTHNFLSYFARIISTLKVDILETETVNTLKQLFTMKL